MANGFESPVQLPNAFPSPGEALQSYINNQQHQKILQSQAQKEKEAQDWRKANLILDMSDLSKHQTASDAANALGDRLIGDVIKKWSNAAPGLSPYELMAGVQKDTSGIITNMDALQTEMKQADEQLKRVKELYPEIDTGSLARDYRADIVHRRMKNDNEFNNPMEIETSRINLGDPEFLSKYVTGNKNITEEAINPKGAENFDAFIGNPQQNVKFSAKIPYFKKPNFTPDQVKDGFLNIKENPKLLFKSSILPSASLPASKDKPFEIIDKDVLERFQQDGKMNLELIASTRKQFPAYDSMNPTEKEYAKRHVLFNILKSLDNSDFHATDVKAAPKWFIKGDSGKSSGSGSDVPWVDIIKEIEEKTSGQNRIENNKGVPFNELSGTTQGVLLDYTNKATGGDYGQEDIFVSQNKNGELKIHDASDGHQLLTIDRKGVAIKANALLGIKGKNRGAVEADKLQKQRSQNKTEESAEERLKRLRAKYH